MAVSYLFVILLMRPYYRKGDDRLHGYAQVELFLLMLRCVPFVFPAFFFFSWPCD
jgi:hypothetical protein